MADIRPFPGIRYAQSDNLAALVTPPYDVISPDAQQRYYERDPHNIIRLELGRETPSDDELDNRYTRAARDFAEWRLHGILAQDAPALYLYEQRFTVTGAQHRRLGLLARVRLEPWEAGVILPHEYTLSKPKDDRLKLFRACAANLSPLMTLYDDPTGELARDLETITQTAPLADFADETGEQHRLWSLTDPAATARVAAFFADRQLYIADGHHRYETSLTYRDEQATLRKEPLAPDDPANFVLMSLSAIEDPGLVVLPTHRVLRGLDLTRLADLDAALQPSFALEPLPTLDDATAVLARAQAAGDTAFVLVRPEGDPLLLRLTDAGRDAMAQLTGEQASASAAWRRLDLAVLHELVLNRALGITPDMVRAGEHVTYTRDADAAIRDVRDHRDGAALAVLVNPTPPAAIRDVARTGDRMPQKSTYFYPKLITGLVINPLW
ncbi:MAG: conserved putative phosphatase [Ktedonobacterales bacterium]|jgi:uncharacterized protein (DUF1015 family)|nr:MAG: conserved putative phosphatase [Ktedonobacterales bacterium]